MTKQNEHDYQGAWEDFNYVWVRKKKSGTHFVESEKTWSAIKSALKKAQEYDRLVALLNNPSKGMLEATECGWHYSDVCRAMAQQALKEVKSEK